MAAEPLDHVLRDPLPWRDDHLTECGRATSDVAGNIITVAELVARFKKYGQQRTAFTVCMTCWERARYAREWTQNPEDVLLRELQRVRDRDGSREKMRAELQAIAALIAAHREEFDMFLIDLDQTTNLAERRKRGRKGK
jgi:hypothetical protein